MKSYNLDISKIELDFINGDMILRDIQPAITFFGSARIDETNPYYNSATKLSNMLSNIGYNIISGGSSGIMEASNKGAFINGKVESIGLNIHLPKEQKMNGFTTKQITFEYLFARKFMLMRYSSGYIVYAGGYGTLDELFEVLTLIQTKKIPLRPIFLVGVDFWQPLYDFITTKLLKNNLISSGDEKLLIITDDLEYIISTIQNLDKESKCQ
jgi:hypothetical protein